MQTFDPVAFKLRYPQFADFSDSNLTDMFNFEALKLGYPIIALLRGADVQYYWACIVLAHICTLEQTGQVGVIKSATEGSVTGEFDPFARESFKYWAQTQYGMKIVQEFYNRGGFTMYPYNVPSIGDIWAGIGYLYW